MSDHNTGDETKTAALSRPGRLELKKTVEGGQVRQSFSHGRSRTVQVEVTKKRTFKPGRTGTMTEVKVRPDALGTSIEPSDVFGTGTRALTEEERAVRARALEDSHRAADEAKIRAEQEADRRAAEEARRQAEAAELARTEQAARRAAEEIARIEVEKTATPEQIEAKKLSAAATAKPAERKQTPEAETESEGDRERRKADQRRLSIGRRDQPRRRTGKITVSQAFIEEERQRSLASFRRHREREKRAQKLLPEQRKVVREVILPEAITVQELAARVAVRGAEVIKTLMRLGTMATINQVIDADTAELVVAEFGHKAKRVSESDVEIGLKGRADTDEAMEPRAPVVTIMGHVDHGKTSLLDALRETDVAGGEAGGITQHIGAYRVEMPSGAQITFLDTPGHEAFTQMRARGAKATDIVVLVVAADDGVMPQTVEAIHHAQAAGVPMVVAINKVDRPDAEPDRVRRELLQYNIVSEELGGDVLTVLVSAKTKLNLDKLEEAILLQSEILDLRANPARSAEGVVIEAKRDRGRGVVTTVLVQRGTLHVGDILVAGGVWGRVRAMVDDKGRAVIHAGPSQPVEVVGLSDTPVAGDDVVVVADEARAREVTEYRQKRLRDQVSVTGQRSTVEQMLIQKAAGATRELPLVIKADVHGSLEAILASIAKYPTKEVAARILVSGVGGITESDVSLAAASKALVIGFNVRADAPARALAKRDGVELRYYSIIYELLEDLQRMLSGMLEPTLRETTLGYARIKQVFMVSKVGRIAGCEVTEGVVRRGARVRLLRDNVVIYDGELTTLRRHKDEAREVKQGLECGMAFHNYQDIKEGDVVEVYEQEKIARVLQA